MSKKRELSKRLEILNALRSVGKKGITNHELSKIALRYGGYLGNLYELGYVIDEEKLIDGIHRYTLISEPEEELKNKPKAIDILKDKIDEKGLISSAQLEELLDKAGLSIRYKAGTHKAIAIENKKKLGEVI